jgi:hypothetical protein
VTVLLLILLGVGVVLAGGLTFRLVEARRQAAADQVAIQTERGRVHTLGKEAEALKARLREAQTGIEQSHVQIERLTSDQGDLRNQLLEAVSDRYRALTEGRAMADRLKELAEVAPPVDDASSPAVPRELPLGRDTVADSIVDGADLGPLVVRAASVRGDRHRQDQEHRRDTVLLRMVEGFGVPVLMSSVAAGAPGGTLSQTAASSACRALTLQLGHYASSLRGRLFDPSRDAELAGTLHVALHGVARSVQLVARGAAADLPSEERPAGDQHVSTSLYAVLSALGDRETRAHIVFGVGDGVVMRLRVEDGEWAWSTVFEPDAETRLRRLPADPEGFSWARFTSAPGDLVVLATRPVAELLQRKDLGEWFAQRWGNHQPYLTSFLSDVNIRVHSTGGDRSLACLWDFGEARHAEESARRPVSEGAPEEPAAPGPASTGASGVLPGDRRGPAAETGPAVR